MKTKIETPSKVLTVQIGENRYDIKFPTNGQIIDIETTKQALSSGQMDNILMTRNKKSSLVYVTIDMVSHFSILIPTLKKDMRVNSLLDLDPMETRQLKDIYINKFTPWYDKWIDIINADYEPEGKEEDKKEDEDVLTTH